MARDRTSRTPTRRAIVGLLLVASCERSGGDLPVAPLPAAQPPSSASGAGRAWISGVVAGPGRPIDGATVFLHADARSGFRGAAAHVAGPTGFDGRFRVEVEPGTWYALASKGEPPAWVGYFGGNPLRLAPGEDRRIVLAMARQRGPDAVSRLGDPGAGSVLEGDVADAEGRVGGADVMAFPAGGETIGPDPTGRAFADAEGRFHMDVPPGEYHVVATRREAGGTVGPLAVGDRFCFHGGNPVEVPPASRVKVSVACVRRPASEPVVGPGRTFVAGTVMDERRAPVPGLTVGAFTVDSVSGTPRASALSRADGRFELELPGGGRWFLVARPDLAGPPVSGEALGLWAGGGNVEIAAGQRLDGVEIVARPVP